MYLLILILIFCTLDAIFR